ncbi:uncharacterized protein FOMMEDRAFT_104101 [Fomitiporia mediterranea MF3/22]|uniref:uncharacterized protein n=1 Tax=Fomitiporia mediterranea (strain MF3/22) TaxID=694068 RepID=UPI0004408B09|nr:uncharacterized protein FOMMEDRAFT_104101 [Fomitiporia mediterranea MF3/22]EJD05827.1 hypothetical protein FOMMEDRAFT_104101 [Fomitiporia mediterranea MF3/22]
MTWGHLGIERTIMYSLVKDQKGGHWQFMTVLALDMSLLTEALSLACDVLPTTQTSLRRTIHETKRKIFLIALPLSVDVALIYWISAILFPTLIIGRVPNPSLPTSINVSGDIIHVPLSLDLALHAAPILSLLGDFFLFDESYGSGEVKRGTTHLCTFSAGYAAWVEYCASYNGVYPYPFLNGNPFAIRVIIYIAVTAIAVLSLRIVNAVHKFLNKQYTPTTTQSESEKTDTFRIVYKN